MDDNKSISRSIVIPVILSGGAGTRLWPVSREGHPKPFMKLADGQSLLLKTYCRAAAVVEGVGSRTTEILTVTNRDYYFMSKDELAKARLGEHYPGVFMLEPAGRNTAPAVAMAAQHLAEKYGRDVLMLILAADHLIQDPTRFAAAVADAVVLAQQGQLVTFGVVPTGPETGFGYIEAGEPIGGGRTVTRFVEKPPLDKAREYVDAGNFYWNSGMFCFQAGVILDEMARHAPDVYAGAKACWDALKACQQSNMQMLEIPAAQFDHIPDISLDYAVMERSRNVVVLPSGFGWSDIGSWSAVSDLIPPDDANNRAFGNGKARVVN